MLDDPNRRSLDFLDYGYDEGKYWATGSSVKKLITFIAKLREKT